ncbi:MAG TPA: tail-specific protease, partial [Salinimicrobium sp.]|nr:tail-specific protease [Salinimicrobium sp.]
MKRNYKILVLVVLFAVASCSFTTKSFDDPNKDKTLIELITYVLANGHYDPDEINDSFSKEVYEDYIESLDPMKRFFYASDIKEFNAYKDKIDDQIKNSELDFFNLTYNRLVKRKEEAKALYQDILETPFDFSKEGTFNTNYEEKEYADSREEMRERWRKQLKVSTLASYYDKIREQQRQLEENPDYVKKTKAELETAAREVTRNSMEEYYNFNDDMLRKDWFSVYVNSIVGEFDPHSFYFAPQEKDRFDIAMSGQLEGIGARLQKKNDIITIIALISGGPAWRGEQVDVGDKILKVKQEDEEQPVNVVGMRLDDAVKL